MSKRNNSTGAYCLGNHRVAAPQADKTNLRPGRRALPKRTVAVPNRQLTGEPNACLTQRVVTTYVELAAPMKLATLIVSFVCSIAFAACTNSTQASNQETAPDAQPTPLDVGATPSIIPSKEFAALAASGVNLNQPFIDVVRALEAKDEANGTAVFEGFMKSMAASLGIKCSGCHVQVGTEIDFEMKTPNMRIAAQMWDRWVVKMQLAGGQPLFCDSCHQGKVEFLVRSTPAEVGTLSNWMKQNFVAGIQNKDGSAMTCTSCHGQPFKGEFLSTW
jgi:hypothetical protein